MFSDTVPTTTLNSQYISRVNIEPAITILLNRPGFTDHDLSNANWPVWSSTVLSALGVAGLKGYITGSIPRPDDNNPSSQWNWDHNDESVQCLLKLFMSKDDELACEHATSASQLWSILVNRHEAHNSNVAVDMQNIMNTRFDHSKSDPTTLQDIHNLVHDIYQSGPPPKDRFFSSCLLNAMKALVSDRVFN